MDVEKRSWLPPWLGKGIYECVKRLPPEDVRQGVYVFGYGKAFVAPHAGGVDGTHVYMECPHFMVVQQGLCVLMGEIVRGYPPVWLGDACMCGFHHSPITYGGMFVWIWKSVRRYSAWGEGTQAYVKHASCVFVWILKSARASSAGRGGDVWMCEAPPSRDCRPILGDRG